MTLHLSLIHILEIMDDDDLHSSDTVQEKLSLVYRFGVRIYYGAPVSYTHLDVYKRQHL